VDEATESKPVGIVRDASQIHFVGEFDSHLAGDALCVTEDPGNYFHAHARTRSAT
jgi:hypothetical protein